jgi:nitrate/nitrite transporter NarK
MPYWRLSSFYLFYFASLGALLPFWGVYLQDQGFTALAIGQLMAILQATKIVAPNVWGWLADRTGRTLMHHSVGLAPDLAAPSWAFSRSRASGARPWS